MSSQAVFETNRAEVLIAQRHVHAGHALDLLFGLCDRIGLLGEQITEPPATTGNQGGAIALRSDASAVDFFVLGDFGNIEIGPFGGLKNGSGQGVV